MELNKPSSTITAAGLAGLGTTMVWEIVMQFMPEIVIRPTLVALSATFIVALVGYMKKETVLEVKK